MKHERLTEGKFYHIYNRGINLSNLFVEPTEYEHFLWLYDKYVSPVAETLAWVLMPNHFHLVVRIKENRIYKYADPESIVNADRSNDAVRFKEGTTSADLSASARPDNINKGKKNPPPAIQQNASPAGTSRFEDVSVLADLSACAAPDNVKRRKRNNEKSWFEEHKWETNELSSADVSGEVRRPVPHRHFAHLFNAYARYFNNRAGRTGNLFERPFKRKLILNESYLKKVILYVHNNPIHHGFCSHPLEYPWSSYLTCISEKSTNLKRENVLKLFNELDGFKKQHNQKIDTGKIEKYLELDVVDYTININTDDFNAVRSNDADPEGTSRYRDLATPADLSACGAPDNVNNKDLNANDADPEATSRFGEATTAADLSVPIDIGGASVNVKKVDCFNADRSRDAVRLANVATTTDLTASARPDNVNNLKKK